MADALRLAAQQDPIALLEQSQWIARVEAGWFSALFAAENKHLAPDYVPVQVAGGRKRALKSALPTFEAAGGQLALMLDPKILTRPDGQPLDADEQRRVNMLTPALAPAKPSSMAGSLPISPPFSSPTRSSASFSRTSNPPKTTTGSITPAPT